MDWNDKEAVSEYNKQWKTNNKQAVSEYMKQWRANNKVSINNYREATQESRRNYNREYERQRRRKRRQEWLDANGPCAHCESWENLEVDHIDPDKKSFKIYWLNSWKKLLPELAKCQVLCHDCHVKKTAQWRKDKDHCKNGHLFDKINNQGQRICSICVNARSRKAYAKKKIEN